MQIKLNNKIYTIKPVSQLTFTEFNNIIVKGKVSTLPEYLAMHTGLYVKQVMQSEIKAASVPYVHQCIFDIDVEKELKTEKNTVKYNGIVYETGYLSLSTFGESYLFDLHLQEYIKKKLNEHELYLYTLAIAIDSENYESIYNGLCEMNWTKVLPQAFFLAKKFRKKKPILIGLLKTSIWALRKTSLKTRFSLMSLRNTERKQYRNYSVKSLMFRYSN